MIAHFHIDTPDNNFRNWYLGIIGFCTKFLRTIGMSRARLKWGLIKRANKELYGMYLESEGLKSVVKDLNEKQAKAIHERVYKILSKHRRLYSSLEQIDFFSNTQTKEISEKTLDNFYYVERHVRRLAFSGTDQIQDDKSLHEFASAISLGSLKES